MTMLDSNVMSKLLPEGLSMAEATQRIAHAFLVSPRMIAYAQAVRDHGSPDLVALVEAGKIALYRAAEIAKTLPPDQQADAARQRKRRTRRTPIDLAVDAFVALDSELRLTAARYVVCYLTAEQREQLAAWGRAITLDEVDDEEDPPTESQPVG